MVTAERDSYDLDWLVRLVTRNFGPLLAGLLGGLAVAVAYLLLATPKYSATARIYIDPRDASVIELSAPAPQAPVDTVAVDSHVEILTSPRIAELTLAALASKHSGQSSEAAGKPEVPPAPVSSKDIETFSKNLSVKRVGSTSIVDISVRDPDAARAALAANEVVRSYYSVLVEGEKGNRTLRTEALSLQAKKEKTTVEELERKLQQLRAIVGPQAPADAAPLADQRMAILAQRVAAAEAQKQAATRRLETFESEGPSGDDAVRLNRIYEDLKAQNAVETKELGPANAGTIKTRAALDETAQKLQALKDEAREPLEADLAAAGRALTDAQSLLGKQQEDFDRIRSNTLDLGETERQAAAAKTVYTSLLARLNEAEAQQSLIVPSFTVVSAASPPLKPASPDKLVTLVFTSLAGLMLAGAFLGWRHAMARVLMDPEDVEAVFGRHMAIGVPKVLAPAEGKAGPPLIHVARGAWQDVSEQLVRGRDLVLGEPAGGRGHRVDHARPEVFKFSDQDGSSAYAEALFRLKTAIMGGGRQPQVVMIASACSGDGKSTLAVNLASYGAKAGLNVLLVDGNLRDRALAPLVAAIKKGPVTTSNGNGSIEQSIIRTTRDFSFCDAAGGRPAPLPMERLADADFTAFLSRMRQKYDLIIVDTPALLEFVDAQAVAPAADMLLMVTDWGRTGQKDATAALKLLNGAMPRKLGIVMNRVPPGERRIWLQGFATTAAH